MKTEKATEFLANNKDAFRLLAEKIRLLDTCKGYEGEEERRGRELAIRTMISWVDEIWEISNASDIMEFIEEDPILKVLDNKDPERGI